MDSIVLPKINKRKTICLNMIVKDESEVIVQTLQRLYAKIKFDYWVICDTGSTDTTVALIQDFFKSIHVPGELFATPWKDFGHNRTLALNHAYKKTDYVLVWDADDDIYGECILPAELTKDVYSFIFGDDKGLRYNRRLMFNNHKKWKYEGVLHEYAVCLDKVEEPHYVTGNYYFISGRSGNRNKDPNKLFNDAKLLKKAYYESAKKKDPMRGRYAFYCANSYFNSEHYDEALEFYKKTLETDAWEQEKYVSCLRLFEIHEIHKQPALGLEYLEKSYEYNKTRVECIYRLVKHYCCVKLPEKAFTHYMRIQHYYENKYLGDDVSKHLFAYKTDYEFNLPYFMIIVSERLKKYEIGVKMYEILFAMKQLGPVEWYMNCLFHNLQYFVDYIHPQNTRFLNNMLTYINGLYQEKQVRLSDACCKTISNIIHRFRPCLTGYTPLPLSRKSPVRIMLTMTTCKRFALFEQTMNSILNCFKDIALVDSFFCVDDNSAEEDRVKMKSLYPFFEFYWKTTSEKGHRTSMNIIWNRLNEIKPVYWVHLEDDWLFFKEANYIEKSKTFLDTYASQNIHQVLFNRHYAETFEEWRMNGGEPLDKVSEFIVHAKIAGIKGLNCGYWPHYSFRPSMVRTEKILELGNFDSIPTFFEYEYAKRYTEKGFKSAFYNEIVSLHIGKLATDHTGLNAYALNDVKQLSRCNTVYYLFYSDEDISEFNHPNIIPIQLQPLTILFNSQGFLNINTLPDVQNIGFITPELFKKTHIKHVDELFQITVDPSTVNGFVFNYENCIYDSQKCHGAPFKELWTYMIGEMGYREYVETDFVNCYCNMWVAERHLVQTFIQWIKQASQILYSAPNPIQRLLNSDALYKRLPPSALLEKIGVPHYTFHSFLLERLIGLFVVVKKLNLLNTNPRKSQNERYVFSCANHAFNQHKYDEALTLFIQTLDTEASPDDKYVSCLRIFEIHELNKQSEQGLEFLEKSYEYSKTRLECVFRLIKHYCSVKLSDTAYTYYMRVQTHYEKADKNSYTFSLESDFFLPYYMIIVAERLKKYKLGLKMYDHIFISKQIPGEWYLNCLFHNLRFFMNALPESVEFINHLVEYINTLYQEKKYRLPEASLKLVSHIIEHYAPAFVEPCLFNPQLNGTPDIYLTITSTGSLLKLDKTLHSVLRCWEDLYRVHGFFCVVEHTEEATAIQAAFPQFTFYWKTPEEKGMGKSMDIIWNTLNTVRPTYWIHLEDNWIFFKQDTYVKKSLDFLDKYESQNICQVMLNRHYAETFEDWSMNGGEYLTPTFVAHSNMTGIKGLHCGNWPHYSIRPSVIRTRAILDIGPYNAGHPFFEYEYAKRYVYKYRSAFFNSISCIQLERQSGIHSYALTNINRVTNNNTIYYLFYSDEDISAFQHPNIIPIQLQPGTILFESQGYLNINIVPDAQNIGFITPSLFYKTHIRSIDELFQLTIEPSTIYGFILNYEHCIGDAVKNHGETFKPLWEYMIDELGYFTQNDFMTCYCNMWVAEKKVVTEFLQCLKQASNILYSAPSAIQTLLNSDAQYKGKIAPAVLLEKFGFPHYTFHTFLLERLVGFFAMVKKCKLVHLHPSKRRNSFLSDPNRLIDYNQQNTFIVNLPSRTDRKEVMIQLFKGLPNIHFFPAIDGQTLEYTQEIQNMFQGNDFGNRKGFIGCALSHVRLWKNLLESDCPYYIIFEDDVSSVEHFVPALVQHRKYVETNLSHIDMFFLGHSVKPAHESVKHQVSPTHCLPLDKEKYIGGFFSYIITRSGAQTLLEYIEHNGIRHGIDYLVKIVPLRCLTAQPHIFFSECAFSKDSAVDSNIQKDLTAFTGNVKKTRVKMLCNWCDSETLCKEWNKFSKGNFIWNDIQITWKDDVDYYVIINKAQKGAFYIPERTIVLQMEPWCGNLNQTWGVKTWGKWADVYKNPDSQFLSVRSHFKHCNIAFWQINKTYAQLSDFVKEKHKEKNKSDIVASICSNKYFDPGHVKRIDFLHFLETKSDVTLHIYNEDNAQQFKSYIGKARPNIDKGRGILPYKYYFMCENNAETNFITEKLWEPILCETLCFYWGCPNVSDYIDPMAYVQLDMNDFEGSYQTIVKAIQSDIWSTRLPFLQKEKKKILESYSFFPIVENIITNHRLEQMVGKIVPDLDFGNICFIHSCTIHDTERLDALLLAIHSSGLIKLLGRVVILNIGKALDVKNYTHPKLTIFNYSEDIHLYEVPTLKLMYRFAQNNDTNILYLHTKGVSCKQSDKRYPYVHDWINYMVYCLINNYKNCIMRLEDYDVVGCNRLESPHPHFSGNFWWAKSSHIRGLSTTDLHDKMSAEWWLLKKSCREYVVHNSGINHFEQPYPLELYKQVMDKKSLITYTYSASEPANYNLRFFIRSICASDFIDYRIVLNGPCPLELELPTLPNVRVLQRENVGYDFGGHFASLCSINLDNYAYFFFINSSVAGPVIPPHFPIHWTSVFIQKITDKVKLVGTTIVCLPETDAGGVGPKVEGFFFMTDRIGLDALLDEQTIFCNHLDKRSAVVNGEYGLSRCIFKHGYTIDCMLQRYQGLDWTDMRNWTQNECKHPSRYNSYFQTSINPYEVIFHKWFWKGEKTVNDHILNEIFPG